MVQRKQASKRNDEKVNNIIVIDRQSTDKKLFTVRQEKTCNFLATKNDRQITNVSDFYHELSHHVREVRDNLVESQERRPSRPF